MNSGRRPSLHRLRGRSLAELSTRGAQVLSVLGERMGAGDTREPSAGGLHGALSRDERRRHTSFDSWIQAFRQRPGTGFFAGVEDLPETARLSRELDPAGVARVVDLAERALEGYLTLLGHADLYVGLPIDWHRDPLRNVSAPRRHWSRIPYLDPRIAGDHKLIWEVNRHQWLVSLGQAWVYTGDRRYVAAIAHALQSWMDANPPKLGVNWASSLEVAFRAISWLWVLRIVGRHDDVPDELVARAVGHLWLSARHITRHLSTYFSANTHLTGEALALYYLGNELAGFHEARQWRETGRRILLEQLPIHVRTDGTYFEQSTWYHRYTLDFYLHFSLLEQRAGHPAPPGVHEALERLATVLMWVMRSDGTMPLIGDDDGGRLLALDARAANDARPALANCAALVESDTLASAAMPSGELAWLLGADGVAAYQRLTPRPPQALSHHFDAGGLIVLRDGWGQGASVMTLDVGEHGVLSGGHAHADALAFDLAIRGLPVLVDPGTSDYTTDPAIRDRFRHTASHNAATVDGDASSAMVGPFAWGETANSTLGAVVTSPGADYVDGAHDGYLRGPARARYRRQLLFLRRGLWILRDTVIAEHECQMEVHLQCAAGIAVTREAGVARLHAGDEIRATIHAADVAATLEVMEGMVSPLYGIQQRAPHLVISGPRDQRHVVHTVIAGADVGVKSVRARREGDGSVVEVLRSDAVDIVGFGAATPLRDGDLVVDADAWWLQRDLGGRVAQWMVAGCRLLELGGEQLVSSVHRIDSWRAAAAHASALESD